VIVAATSCQRVRRGTGHAYMPDMGYSVAYETYAPAQERLDKYGAHYNNQPVAGTIARGDVFPYKPKNDSAGLLQAASITNPLTTLEEKDMQEAGRLYLVNCAICHGAKLNGDGPLFKGGDGPFTSKPADLVASKMTEGSMFHVATYGKGQMGSYASQLTTRQRWMIVSYIKNKQSGNGAGNAAGTPDSLSANKAKPDSAAVAPK
ncbi:MAG TPA: cytochrome c, partial [Chitinophagaceae bacterium]|nr:cytochrome c [Chitinophagaceae bacterium]